MSQLNYVLKMRKSNLQQKLKMFIEMQGEAILEREREQLAAATHAHTNTKQ
jgi:hypothetical protein